MSLGLPLYTEPDTAIPRTIRELTKPQVCSVWLEMDRAAFTAQMRRHFEAMQLPATSTVTLQIAARRKALW